MKKGLRRRSPPGLRGSTRNTDRPDEEGIKTELDEMSFTWKDETQTDLMKKGLRLRNRVLTAKNRETQTDLMKKGLRR